MAEITGSLPFVSVFVPARNEESNLEACLGSLLAQQYEGGWEILFADDDSNDLTWSIAKKLETSSERLKIFQVKQEAGKIQGKQRALAQLGEEAAGDIFLFCDADMQMPQGWLESMAARLSRGDADLINGTTCPDDRSVFGKLQALDWLFPQMAMSLFSRLGFAYTAMGNNMGITRKAYESIGGYSGIPASITEDYELFRQAEKKGFRLLHLYEKPLLGITQPAKNPEDWFSQHLRWTSGFRQLPLLKRLPVYLSLLHFPAMACLLLSGPAIYLHLLAGLWLLKLVFWISGLMFIGKKKLILWIPVYECLYLLAYTSLFISSFFRKHLVWKGRKVKAS